MCLISKDNEPKIAEKDIRCYKVLEKNGNNYYTPFVGRPVPYPPCRFKATGNPFLREQCNSDGNVYFYVGGGFIHSYSQPYKGLRTLGDIGNFIFSAVIPKGSLYYRGVDGDYASTDLKIEQELCNFSNCHKDSTVFCEVEGKTYTIGEIKDLIRRCSVLHSWNWFMDTSWTIALLGTASMPYLNICGNLKDATIMMSADGFLVTQRGTRENMIGETFEFYTTSRVDLEDIVKLIEGGRVTFYPKGTREYEIAD